MIRISVTTKGFMWTTTSQGLAHVVATGPHLWESHPELALAFAFGPPDGVVVGPDGLWVAHSITTEVELPNDPDADIVAAIRSCGQERGQLLARIRTKLNANQQEDALALLGEYCNVVPGERPQP